MANDKSGRKKWKLLVTVIAGFIVLTGTGLVIWKIIGFKDRTLWE
jgi:hypothetical protein